MTIELEEQSQDTSQQGTSADTQVTTAPETDKQEQLIGGKFKSTDEVLKSYNEAEKEMHREKSEKAEWQKRYYQILEQQQVVQRPAQEQEYLTEEEKRISDLQNQVQTFNKKTQEYDSIIAEQRGKALIADHMDKNKDLSDMQDLFLIEVESTLKSSPYQYRDAFGKLDSEKLLNDATNNFRPRINKIVEKAKKEATERRVEVKESQLLAKGEEKTKEEGTKRQSPEDYVAQRNAQRDKSMTISRIPLQK